jgi:hypothetical protein
MKIVIVSDGGRAADGQVNITSLPSICKVKLIRNLLSDTTV